MDEVDLKFDETLFLIDRLVDEALQRDSSL